MKILITLVLIIPQFIFAQKIKTRTQYQSHDIQDSTTEKIMAEVLYYSLDSLVIKEENFTDNKISSVDINTYNADKTLQKSLHYDVNGDRKLVDSTAVIESTYNYLSTNKVQKIITQIGTENSVSSFITDANGRKISDNYIYTIDAKNRLKERYRKNNDKKSARIEKYFYLPNNNIQALKIFIGKKPVSVTTYFYNLDNQLAKEVSKTFKGKKSTSDIIYYQYSQQLLQKEISVTTGTSDTVVEYSYTFYE